MRSREIAMSVPFVCPINPVSIGVGSSLAGGF